MNPWLRTLLVTISLVFLILGLIGLFVPVLQGFIFIAVGLYILSLASRRFKRTMESHIGRYPRFRALYEKYRRMIDNLWHKRKSGEDETP